MRNAGIIIIFVSVIGFIVNTVDYNLQNIIFFFVLLVLGIVLYRSWKQRVAHANALKKVLTQDKRAPEALESASPISDTNQIDLERYRLTCIDEYVFMATLDERTCEVCRALDGKHFLVSEARAGVNFPPMHEGCRCTTVEYDPDDALDWAVSGKPMPENMSYEEWITKYKDTRIWEIIEDCKRLTFDTKDIEVFLTRYDLWLQKAMEISNQQEFDSALNLYPDRLMLCIKRCEKDAATLKTVRGQQNRLIKLSDKLCNFNTDFPRIEEANLNAVNYLQDKIEALK